MVSLLLVGHATNLLRSVAFLAFLFAGWTVLATVRYAVTRSTGDALLAVLTAAFLAYYLVRRRTRDQSLASSAGR